MSSKTKTKTPEKAFNWYAKPRGPADAPVVFVIGVPGYHEERTRVAMANDVYAIVSSFVKSTGLKENQCVYICCTNYHKKGSKPSATELLQSWDEYLKDFIELHDREIVIAMGNEAICALHINDKPEGITKFRGQALTLKNGVKATATLNPFIVGKNPDEGNAMVFDLKCAFATHSNTVKKTIPVEQNWMESVGAIEEMTHKMLTSDGKHNTQAYDHETDNGSAHHALSVLACFCNGLRNDKGEYKVDIFAPYDKMQPRFGPNKLLKLNKAIRTHYTFASMKKQEQTYGLLAHNRLYDDWVTDTNYFRDGILSFKDDKFIRTPTDLPGSFYMSRHDAMIASWVLDSLTPNDAKTTLHRICGYPEYDDGIKAGVKAVTMRRSRVLQEEDLRVLAIYGKTPVENVLANGTISYKWPKTVDKKICSYSMVDLDLLAEYCCYDAAGTWMAFFKMKRMLKEQGKWKNYLFRMKLAEGFVPGERRGFFIDMKTNRRLSGAFATVEESTVRRMRRYVKKHTDLPKKFAKEYAPSKDNDTRKVLYGNPVMVPTADTDQVVGDVMEHLKCGRKRAVSELAAFHEEFYNKFDAETVATIKSLDDKAAEFVIKNLRKAFNGRFNVPEPAVKPQPMYVDGEIRPAVFTKTGLPSVARAVLETYYEINPTTFVQYLLMYKKASKLKSVYVDGLLKFIDENNILRPHYNSIGTNTGRPSSSKPNGQNFNKYVKGQAVPRPGFGLLEADVKQAEVVTIAAASMDSNLLNAIKSSDVHSATASLMFGIPLESVGKDSFERRAAKTITFGLIYGMMAARLAMALGITIEEAEDLMVKFFMPYADLKAWIDLQPVLARRPPYQLRTAFGTTLSSLGILSVDNETRQHWERVAVNMPIQGTAAEYVMYCIYKINQEIRRMGWEGDAGFINNIHDSMAYEATDRLAWKDTLGNVKGEMRDLVVDTVGAKPPVAPINIVRYGLDVELNQYWGTKPNVNKAIDPKFGDTDHEGNPVSKIRWDLITSDLAAYNRTMDKDELGDLKEIDWDKLELYSRSTA